MKTTTIRTKEGYIETLSSEDTGKIETLRIARGGTPSWRNPGEGGTKFLQVRAFSAELSLSLNEYSEVTKQSRKTMTSLSREEARALADLIDQVFPKE